VLSDKPTDEEIYEAYRQLKTLYAVAKKLGVHAQQVKRIVGRMEQKRRVGEDVRRLEGRI